MSATLTASLLLAGALSTTPLARDLARGQLNPQEDALLFAMLRADPAVPEALNPVQARAFLSFLERGEPSDPAFDLWRRARTAKVTDAYHPSCFLVLIGFERKDGTYGAGLRGFGHTDISLQCWGPRPTDLFFEAGYDEHPTPALAWQGKFNNVRPFQGLVQRIEALQTLYIPEKHRTRPDAYMFFDLRVSRLTVTQVEVLEWLAKEMGDTGPRALNFGPYKNIGNNCNHATMALLNTLLPQGEHIYPAGWSGRGPRIPVPPSIFASSDLQRLFPVVHQARIDERDPARRTAAWESFRADLAKLLPPTP